MRIALLLTGHLRTFRIASEFLSKYRIDGAVVDIYIGVWDDDEELIKEQTSLEIYNIYSPKIFRTYPKLNINIEVPSEKSFKTNPNNTKSMFYIRKQLFSDFKSYSSKLGLNYDYLILSRFDVVLSSQLKLEKSDSEKLLKGDLLLFNGAYSSEFGGVSDILSIGKQSVIERCLEFYNQYEASLERFISEEKYLEEIIPEVILGRYLDNVGLNYTFLDNNLFIVRPDTKQSIFLPFRYKIINYLTSILLYGDEILNLIHFSKKDEYKLMRDKKLLTDFGNIFTSKIDLDTYKKVVFKPSSRKNILNKNDEQYLKKIIDKTLNESLTHKDENFKIAYLDLYIFILIRYIRNVKFSLPFFLTIASHALNLKLIKHFLGIITLELFKRFRFLIIKYNLKFSI